MTNKKIIAFVIIVTALIFLAFSPWCFAAWDNDNPADNVTFDDAMGEIRANNDAIEVALGVDLAGNGILNTQYNVKSSVYGALGDGSTDDKAAIQLAIDAANAAGGGTVYFPPSSTDYVISGVLTLYSDITLLGDSFATSTIFLKASSDTLMINALARDNITIKNLTLDGNNDNSNTKALITLTACHDTEITKCKLTNTDLFVIFLVSSATRTCENNTFHHNIIEDTGSIAIKIKAQGDASDTEDTLYTKVNYNYFTDTGYSAIEVVGQYCHYTEIIGNIAFECVAPVYDASKSCTDVIIADNIAVTPTKHASLGSYGAIFTGRGDQAANSQRIIIENNIIIGDSTEDVWGIQVQQANDVIIQGNMTYDIGCTTGAAIYIASTSNTNIQILNNYVEDSEYKGIYVANDNERIVISGNNVYDTVQESIGSTSPAIITDNHCEEAGTNGIYLQADADRCIVSNNICKNNNNAASGTRAGIVLSSVDYCVVTGNICQDDQGTETQDYGIYTLGTSTLNVIRNNELSDNKTGAVSLVGANYTDETLGVVTLANDATPTVGGGSVFITGGTTTITDFDDGYTGKVIIIMGSHTVTITDGTHIILDGGASMSMTAGDTLMLVQKADTYWYQLSEANNN